VDIRNQAFSPKTGFMFIYALAQTTQPHLATRCGALVALSNASSRLTMDVHIICLRLGRLGIRLANWC
jgi:hypothetical protein